MSYNGQIMGRSYKEAKASDVQVNVRLSQEQLDALRVYAENSLGLKIDGNALLIRYCLSLLDENSFGLEWNNPID